MGKQYAVYLMCNQARGTLYIGVTGNLLRRVWEHKQGAVDGFTKRYGVKQLAWFELYGDILQAIQREKQLKRWQRDWKIRLVERNNPQWRDLWMDIR